MDILDLLLNPVVLVGCFVGVGAAALLHWLFPAEDLAVVQALLILLFIGIGMFVQVKLSESDGKE